MSGLDFLKSCSTNVRAVENLYQTQYKLYLPLEGAAHHGELHYAIRDLRQHNILCAGANEELYIFGSSLRNAEISRLLEAQECTFTLEGTDTVGSHPSNEAADGRALKEILLDAIQGSISFILVQEQGMLHVGSWRWAFCPAEGGKEQASTLIRLHANLTNDGTLYMSTTVHACYMRPIAKSRISKDVLLTPSGCCAKLVADQREENTDTAHRPRPAVASDTWKRSVEDILGAEGLHINSDDEWVMVDLQEQGVNHHVLWPARLCLSTQPHSASTDKPDWRYWFSKPVAEQAHVTYQHPLLEAEEWFARASAPFNNSSDRPNTSFDYSTGPTSMVIESPLATSPPFNQRMIDHQAAMSGIYPTPPDGLMPAHLLGHNSTSDGGPSDGLQTDPLNTQLLGSDDNQQDDRPQSFSAEPQSYPANNLAVDDLFGDMVELDDELDANDIGDADFDYFDDPDEMPVEPTDAEEDVERATEQNQAGAEEPDRQEYDSFTETQSMEVETPVVSEVVDISEPVHETTKADDQAPETDIAIVSGSDEVVMKELDKPLSPFHIREQLLPPPIPASANQQQGRHLQRRSTFDPIIFNNGLDLSSKHIDTRFTEQNDSIIDFGKDKLGHGWPNISLPPTQKKPRVRKPSDPKDSGVDDLMETSQSSDEDSYDDVSSMSEGGEADDVLPPKLPWDTKKRKRDSAFEVATLDQLPDDLTRDELEAGELEQLMTRLGEILMSSRDSEGRLHDWTRTPLSSLQHNGVDEESDGLPSVKMLHRLSKEDLVYIAQIICEQAVTTTPALAQSIHDVSRQGQGQQNSIASTIQTLVANAVSHILPQLSDCSLSSLALSKEPPPRAPTSVGKMPQAPHPRPHMREGSVQLGPDYFQIPLPYVQIQRGSETWEMLPPALSFWSALGLGPANGSKDLNVLCVVPNIDDLTALLKEFVKELGLAYEGCKLGSFNVGHSGSEEIGNEMQELVDGVIAVQSDGANLDLSTMLIEYATLCDRLGKALAKIGHTDSDRTIVVCIINPFEGLASAQQHLCTCFYLLYKAYRDNTLKAHRNLPRSDLVLQILPISLIASPDGMVLLSAEQMGALATELYDRCPPSPNTAMETLSALPMLAAPAVELASPPPKRIGFQLSADPPSDLLHEGSVLHLAYAISRDREWITMSWMDHTGRYQRTTTASLRGKTYRDVLEEAWEQTLEILSGRDVTWRVLVVASQSQETDKSIQDCWRNVAAIRPRKQILHVTLLSVEQYPELKLAPPSSSDGIKATNIVTTPGGGFLTPVSTPQATSFTVSPDASGQNNGPLTPAPSDTAANIVENDPDALLLDLADESWGMLLAPPFKDGNKSVSQANLASGLLFRRGEDSSTHIDGLGLNLHWDIRIRPNGLVEDGPQKQVEANLREVLKMYRGLSLLARVRGLDGTGREQVHGDFEGDRQLMPFHVLSAVRGAEALNGLLR